MSRAAHRAVERSAHVRTALRSSTVPLLVLAIGCAASSFVYKALDEAVDDVARLRFERAADDARAAIEGRVHAYANVLYGLRGLFATHAPVTRLQFRRFVEALELPQRYPGFDVVNFAQYVPGAEAERFVQTVRNDTSLQPEGYPDFSIRPPGERTEYFVISYLEPMEGYEFAFGRDLASHPQVSDRSAFLSALRHARDTGRLTASGVPIRVQKEVEYVSLALRLPVYRQDMPLDTPALRREAYVGSVGAAFNIAELMKGVLNPRAERSIRLRLYDTGSVDGAAEGNGGTRRLLYDSRASTGKPPLAESSEPLYSHKVSLDVGRRVWALHFDSPRRLATDPLENTLPVLVLLGGLLSSLLLSGAILFLSYSRRRAIELAQNTIRDLQNSESSLLESQTLLNDAQKLAQVGCAQYVPDDERMIWSEQLYRIHGVEPSHFPLSRESAAALVHPSDRSRWVDTMEQALRSGKPFTADYRIVRPDGEIRHVRALGEVIGDVQGRPQRVLWSVVDTSEHHQTEEALRDSAEQLKALSRRLVDVQEQERRHLSRELHDRVGQNLTALSINLDMLRTSLAQLGRQADCARLADSSALLESTVDTIEDVMAELRPPMLDDYGLLPALHWYAREFTARTGIAANVSGDDGSDRLRPEVEIALFRIAQEALTNVAKHARAGKVEITLRCADAGRCTLTVVDDGVGLESSEETADRPRAHLGLVNMRERAQAVGGRFTIERSPQGGTRLEVVVP